MHFLENNFPQESLYLDISFFVVPRTMSSKNIPKTFICARFKISRELLHEHELEITTKFFIYYSYDVGKGESKVRGAPQINSGYEREC